MSDRIETDLKMLRGEFADLRDDVKNIATTLRELIEHGGEAVLSNVRSSKGDLQGDLEKLAQTTAARIEEKPLASALTSFGIGVVLGVLFSGRRA